MKRIPLHVVISQVMRLPLPQRVEKLVQLTAAEKPFSVRRNELQSLLEGARFKMLRQENRMKAA